MDRLPVVLVEDPAANRFFDLAAILAHGGSRVAAVVTPAAPVEAAETPAAADGDALWKACATTAGAPVPVRTFRIATARVAAPGTSLPPHDTIAALLRLVPPPFAVVAFVSRATLPILEALHADTRTQPLLKLGVTSARLDAAFTLAEKLADSGKLHYHEHTQSLARLLPRRLQSMIRAHAQRAAGSGS